MSKKKTICPAIDVFIAVSEENIAGIGKIG